MDISKNDQIYNDLSKNDQIYNNLSKYALSWIDQDIKASVKTTETLNYIVYV